MVKKSLVAVDGSPSSDKALELAFQLAANSGAKLLALTVASADPLTAADVDVALERYQPEVSPLLVAPAFSPATGQEGRSPASDAAIATSKSRPLRDAMAQHVLAAAKTAARRYGFSSLETLLRSGDAVTNILAVAAAESPDLLVMGSRGLGARAKNLLGGVSHKVVNEAACSVITVKSPDLED